MREASGGDDTARRVGEADVVREVFDGMPIALVGLAGPEHTFVAANVTYRELVGRSDLIGMPIRKVLPEVAGQQLFELLDRVYATGQSATALEWRIQLDRDQTDVPQELYVDFHVTARRAADGTIIGLLTHITDVTDRVREQRAAQAQTVATQRRYDQAREVIHALQRELLPAGLPVLPGARIAGSYLLADADTAAGGDWFDAVSLPDGRLALVVGDVVGHGVRASAVMGQLRAVLADRLSGGANLATALAAADRMAQRTPGARAATVCVAMVDVGDGSVSYCTAGHPPPLLVSAHGETRYLPATGAGPLGTGAQFALGTSRLDVGDVLLLYSDGIIERPDRAVVASTVELAQVAADTTAGRSLNTGETSPVERVCTQTLELLVRATGHADDITLLAAQRVDPVPDLDLRVPADVPAVPATRKAVGGWLDELGACGTDVLALQHAIGELVTNAVEHAYSSGDTGAGSVAVHATLTLGGEIRVEVSDHGRWREGPGDSDRGRGLAMSTDLVDVLRIDRGLEGTTAVVVQRLSRPARLLTAAEILSGIAPAPARQGQPELVVIDQSSAGGSRIRVNGPLDVATAPRLHAELLRRTRGGTERLTVDLTGVTHLASAGVAVLHSAARAGAELQLYAPAGSTAQHVLALVALPHTTSDPG